MVRIAIQIGTDRELLVPVDNVVFRSGSARHELDTDRPAHTVKRPQTPRHFL